MFCRRIIRDSDGAVLVEVTVMMTIIFVFILGSIDFLLLFYQWNMAAKAAEIGARIAAVSDPVAAGLNQTASSGSLGGSLPSFTVSCTSSIADGSAGTCTCSGTCTNVGSYTPAPMQAVVFGRGSASCTDGNSTYNVGMCDIFTRIDATNVRITYTQTGLGFAGRPGGVVPTITVELRNMPFQYFFLGGLLGFANINIPTVRTTITGEDLCSSNAC
jgi:Flp pilus assembly protein TadG